MKAGAFSAPLPAHWHATAFRGIAGLCLLFQLPLIWAKTAGSPESRLIGLLIFLPLGIPVLFWKIKFPGWLQMGVVAGTAGGLAMLAGNSLDQARNGNVPSCCQLPNPGLGALLNWSNGLMASTCLAACILLCPGGQSSLYQPTVWLKHLGCLGGMWLGMILGGHLLTCLFKDTFGAVAGMDMAMIIGMAAGAAVSHMLFWRNRDLRADGVAG